jgi:hypothetical protein
MTRETARVLWKAAAIAVPIAILAFIATRDALYAWLSFGIVFLGFWLYAVMYPKKPSQ